jgi:hypothetical protein
MNAHAIVCDCGPGQHTRPLDGWPSEASAYDQNAIILIEGKQEHQSSEPEQTINTATGCSRRKADTNFGENVSKEGPDIKCRYL